MKKSTGFKKCSSGIFVPNRYKRRNPRFPADHLEAQYYDAAATTQNNREHWQYANNFSADTANSSTMRTTNRNRARYESANNCYILGIINTRAIYTIGTGPRLQMLLQDSELNQRIEYAFQLWSEAMNLAQKLLSIRKAQTRDGEGFGLIHDNEKLNNPVKIDIMPFECDRVAGEYTELDENDVDGIKIDAHGNPVSYRVLKSHPGSDNYIGQINEAETFSERSVVHVFRVDRPEQHRGISEIMPALPLSALLRRASLAIVSALEFAASFSGVTSSSLPYGDEESQPEIETMEEINLARNMLTILPNGMNLSQIKSEHPNGTYQEFKHEILNEIARVLDMPYNIAAANSSGYNYSSGRLDHQMFYKSISVDQSLYSRNVMDAKIFPAWLEEYALLNTWVFDIPEFRETGSLPHAWFWDGYEAVDPVKEANANKILYENRHTTLQAIYAKKNKDWEKEIRQYAREEELLKELGVTKEEALAIA